MLGRYAIPRSLINEWSATLTITYPCANRGSYLSRVQVYNGGSCCWARINAFSIDFINADGIKDRASYTFTAPAVAQYNVTVALA